MMKRNLSICISVLFIIVLSLGQSSTANAQTNLVDDNVELAVLKKIYDSLGGAGWTTKTNWPTAATWPANATAAQFGTWYGVTVTNGDITRITLNNNLLTGRIPSTIGDLQRMNYLAMHTNSGIIGSIPSSLTTINVLQDVYLYTCNLTGQIPAGLFNLPGIQTIHLATNKLTGSIPVNAGNAINLVT